MSVTTPGQQSRDQDLTLGECLVGIIGLGLLRLHRSGDVSAKATILSELRSALDHLDEPPLNRDSLGERLGVVSGYERWAAVYDLPDNPVIDHEQVAVWQLLDALPGEPVLDAACGTGRHLEYLTVVGRTAIGVDLSSAMLARARAKVPTADLRKGDLLAIPLEDNTVGGAVCALALEHVQDLPRAFRELARVVRPGGWVIVSTTHPAVRSILGWGAWCVDGRGRGALPTYRQSLSDYLNAAHDAGLILVQCKEPAIGEHGQPPATAGTATAGETAALDNFPVVLICHFTLPTNNSSH